MKLAYALLADAAQVTLDGKISMLGGDIDTIRALRFPATHPNMALVMRFDVEQRECGVKHHLSISVTGALGAQVIPPISTDFTPQRNPIATEQTVRALMVINMQSLVFPSRGKYQFHIRVDDEVKGSVKLVVTGLDDAMRATRTSQE